jgi:hypothetical protein
MRCPSSSVTARTNIWPAKRRLSVCKGTMRMSAALTCSSSATASRSSEMFLARCWVL